MNIVLLRGKTIPLINSSSLGVSWVSITNKNSSDSNRLQTILWYVSWHFYKLPCILTLVLIDRLSKLQFQELLSPITVYFVLHNLICNCCDNVAMVINLKPKVFQMPFHSTIFSKITWGHVQDHPWFNSFAAVLSLVSGAYSKPR